MFELSNHQMAFYTVDKAGVGQAVLLCGSVIIPRKIELEELQRAANEVFRINDGLRTRFVEKDDGKVYQELLPFEERTFEVKRFESREALDAWGSVYATIPLKLDIRSEGGGIPKSAWKSGSTPPALVKNVIKHNMGMFFTKLRYGMLGRGPACCELILAELPEACGAIIKMHHVVSDAATMLLVANQFIRIVNGETPRAYRYEDFLRSDEEYRQTKRFERDSAFFEKQYEKCPEPTWVWDMPITTLEAVRRTVTLDEALTGQIRAYAAAHELSPYILFLTAMSVFMSRKMGRDTFYVGSVVVNRAGIRERNTAGMFVNAVPLLMELDGGESFADALVRTRDANFSAFRHQRGVKDNDTRKLLYDMWVSFQDAALEADATTECTQYYCNYVSGMKIFTVEDRAQEGRFKIHFDHNVLVTEPEVDEMFRVVLGVLREGMADDSRPLRELGK